MVSSRVKCLEGVEATPWRSRKKEEMPKNDLIMNSSRTMRLGMDHP